MTYFLKLTFISFIPFGNSCKPPEIFPSISCFEVTRGKINKFHSTTNTLFPIQRRARALSTLGRLITINYGNINTLVSDKFAYRSPQNNLFLRFAYPQVKNRFAYRTKRNQGVEDAAESCLRSMSRDQATFHLAKFFALAIFFAAWSIMHVSCCSPSMCDRMLRMLNVGPWKRTSVLQSQRKPLLFSIFALKRA